MRRCIFILFCLAGIAAIAPAGQVVDTPPGFVTLCYHDIPVEVSDLAPADAMPIVAGKLIDQFDWLRQNGYTTIGVDDILAARDGSRPLPEKAVLLSFDDGYASFHRIVYPLLKSYNYKALLALETTWLETPDDQPVPYGDQNLPRSYFMEWPDIKEMADSGLVELASHSHNLHRGHSGMPQGISLPASSTLEYDPETKTYETEEEYYYRIRADVAHSAGIIEQRTGHRPRVLVWPYGRYSNVAVRAALDAGYSLTASLGIWADGPTFPRYLMYNTATLHDVMVAVERGYEPGHSAYSGPNLNPGYADLIRPVYPLQRVMHVDLDTVYDEDPVQQNKNISALFDRVKALGANIVYLQAYADPDGNGTTGSLYFPNRHLPVRSDLFNYVSWQLQRRLGMQVYAWMPVLGYEIPGRPLVQATAPGHEGSTYSRLTPFDAENRRIIKEIFEDLARHSTVTGILYHDDAVLGDYEDAGPAAMAWLEEIGLPADLDAIRRDKDMTHYFSRMKTKFLTDFTNELTGAMQTWSPRLKTARNLYAQVVLNPDSEDWFAQNYNDFLCNYHYVGLMAMPYMEGERGNPDDWLKKLAALVEAHPLGRQKTVFELQAMDWKTQQPISSETLARQMRLLQVNGIGNLGYYPEDPIKNHPDIGVIYPSFSLVNNKYARTLYDPDKQAEPAAEITVQTEQVNPSWYVERRRGPSSPTIVEPNPRR